MLCAMRLLSCLSICLSVTLVYCGQTVGWIKMPLGTEVGLGPGDIVLDGDPAPPTERSTEVSHFLAHFYSGQAVAHFSNCWALVKWFRASCRSSATTHPQVSIEVDSNWCRWCFFATVVVSTADGFFSVSMFSHIDSCRIEQNFFSIIRIV